MGITFRKHLACPPVSQPWLEQTCLQNHWLCSTIAFPFLKSIESSCQDSPSHTHTNTPYVAWDLSHSFEYSFKMIIRHAWVYNTSSLSTELKGGQRHFVHRITGCFLITFPSYIWESQLVKLKWPMERCPARYPSIMAQYRSTGFQGIITERTDLIAKRNIIR